MQIQRPVLLGLLLLFSLALLLPLSAQNEAAPAPAAPAAEGTGGASSSSPLPTWLVKLKYGGWVSGVQLALSVVAGGYFVGCLLAQRRKNINPAGFTDQAKSLWAAGRFQELETLAQNNSSTIARIVLFLVRHRSTPSTELSSVAGDIASREISTMAQRAYPLAVIGNLEPMLGLLGTIFGMIDVFDVVAVAGELGDPGMMADGISKALVTTAVGLVLAIPMLSAYHYFKIRPIAMPPHWRAKLRI
ncbi:MAG: MotA/TolQ/ExbB proton channel family protein [Blastochloris sp.]|nr:MotA/TolQ/ExbB proton channel family protein [Blastochloris sp.]